MVERSFRSKEPFLVIHENFMCTEDHTLTKGPLPGDKSLRIGKGRGASNFEPPLPVRLDHAETAPKELRTFKTLDMNRFKNNIKLIRCLSGEFRHTPPSSQDSRSSWMNFSLGTLLDRENLRNAVEETLPTLYTGTMRPRIFTAALINSALCEL
jgi:hypothetical protein